MFDELPPSRDQLFHELRDIEREIASARSRQVRVVRELTRQFGEPSRSELAATLDISSARARALLREMTVMRGE